MNRHGDIRQVYLERDCEATQIPWGSSTTLPGGSLAQITQQLGGNFTVMVGGNLYRISGANADALGLDPSDAGDPNPPGTGQQADDPAVPPTAESVEAEAWRRLGTCYDPEIPVDIVNLGLVYLCQAMPLPDGGFRLDVRMTLTAPGCGMGMTIADEAREKLMSIRGVEQVDVDLVWDPPWSREMMSESARLEMGLM
ncbi:MAG: putative Fe-S cluster assembly protein SufT [Lautropia sp. SCN 70-15]|jgi:probable FeS assembly SUF system protein SufT|nr:MAG: putative Fe-S cluster assembly protein SufT [Lautropia sp. SCN 70-15]